MLTPADLTAPLLVSEQAAAAAPIAVTQSLWGDICILCKQPTFLFNALGACPLQGAFGVYSYFGPQVRASPCPLPPCTPSPPSPPLQPMDPEVGPTNLSSNPLPHLRWYEKELGGLSE